MQVPMAVWLSVPLGQLALWSLVNEGQTETKTKSKKERKKERNKERKKK